MYVVIMAGGGGTRLWPLSRPDRPKPFLPLTGDETLLQATVRRLEEGSELGLDRTRISVVTDRRRKWRSILKAARNCHAGHWFLDVCCMIFLFGFLRHRIRA